MLSRIKLYGEKGEEHANCSKDFCIFGFFLGYSMKDFFGQ